MAVLADIMTRDVTTATAEDSVAEAAAAMVAGRFGSVLVMTGSTLVGILTERDVLRAAAATRDLAADRVRNWMTPDPICASPDTATDEAEVTMMSQGIRHLPVTENSTVVGIVSLRDLFSARIHRRA